MYKMLNYCGAR